LGSAHLHNLGNKFRPHLLDGLIATLKHFGPDLICVENLSGEVIERMQCGSDKTTAKQFASGHIRFAKKAQKLVGSSRVEAERRSRKLLSQRLTTPKRLELILLFLAAYDSNSAALQWSYLPQKIRETNDKIPKDIRSFLDKGLGEPNEVISIGLRLARELNLQMLAATDDHPDFDPAPYTVETYSEIIGKSRDYFSREARTFMKDFDERYKNALGKSDLLPFYQYLNSPKTARVLVDLECLTYVRMNHPSGLNRARLAEWETRNLVMTAYIRRATAMYGGKRVLVIVGCSHKPLFDRYLRQLVDIEVVQFRDVEVHSRAGVKKD
jgi:hypothetical protein